MNLLLFKILTQKKYFLIFVIFSLAMGLVYPLLQVAPQGLNNFWFWFGLLKPIDWLLYLLYSVVFGLSFSVFVWRNDKKLCSTSQLWQSGILGFFSSFFATLIPLCPQCFSYLVFVIPTTGLSFLAEYRREIMLVVVGLMGVSLWLLGAFDSFSSSRQN